ncbi:LOW QUALITY PROTEIN: hypothetical protein PoB_000881000 [Plakobranchus ocellatus]|uniref:Uncharacterized protein n=1 Tax=Plakobranchus ocellatus TaxID=259542 RepID=A0AAV3YHU5_9GAST|nr:LOW QUALITY PROTEIN: hypothetical protein PoB_000881000 [Plakobranchus ocellatus]
MVHKVVRRHSGITAYRPPPPMPFLKNEVSFSSLKRAFRFSLKKIIIPQMQLLKRSEGKHAVRLQGVLRLSGPPSGQDAGGGARTRDRRVTADLRETRKPLCYRRSANSKRNLRQNFCACRFVQKASAPVRRRQYLPPEISKDSASIRRRQYPPPGIFQASVTVRRRQYPPSAVANIPDQGYSRPVPLSAVANISHQEYRRPVPQSADAIIPLQEYRRRVPQSAVAIIRQQGYKKPVPQSTVANIPTRDIKAQCPSPPLPISPTRDIKRQCSSPPSPISPHQGYQNAVLQSAMANIPPPGISKCSAPVSPTRDIKSQCSSPPSPISPIRDIKSQCSRPPSPISPHQGYQKPVLQSAIANIPPSGISKASAPVRHRQYPPIRDIKSQCSRPPSPISPHQRYQKPVLQSAIANFPPPGISKASAPVSHRQYPPSGISKASAPVRHRQ